MNRLSKNIVAAGLGLTILSVSCPVDAEAKLPSPQAVCTHSETVGAFKNLMREWSLKQSFLEPVIADADRNGGPQWLVRGAKVSLGKDGIPGIDKGWTTVPEGEIYACEADFEYRSLLAVNGFNPKKKFVFNKAVFTVADYNRPDGSVIVTLQEIPERVDAQNYVEVQDRLTVADLTIPQLMGIEKRLGSAPPSRERRRPQNAAEALVQMQASYDEQVEALLRSEGYGEMVDAEKARRAKMSPSERAAEDSWNRGPAKGQTICRADGAITRCKTGD